MVGRVGSRAARLTEVGIRANVLARLGRGRDNRARRGSPPLRSRLRLHRRPRRPRVLDGLLHDPLPFRPGGDLDAGPYFGGLGSNHELRRDRRGRGDDAGLACNRLDGRLRRRKDRLGRNRRLCGHPRNGCGCRSGGDRSRGQQTEWIDIPLWVARLAHPEVDVGLGVAFRGGRADDAALVHDAAALDADRTEMQQGRRIAGRGLDRDRLTARRDRAHKRDNPFHGRKHPRTGRRSDVDASVLARRIRRGVIEDERSQHRAFDRPRPGLRSGHGQRESAQQREGESPHKSLLVVRFENCERR